MKGNGGNYNVSVDVVKTFGDATITVDQPTFNLAGEQLLNITLTASQASAPNGSEILGYIHIDGGATEASLPFAADFAGAIGIFLQGFNQLILEDVALQRTVVGQRDVIESHPVAVGAFRHQTDLDLIAGHLEVETELLGFLVGCGASLGFEQHVALGEDVDARELKGFLFLTARDEVGRHGVFTLGQVGDDLRQFAVSH